MLRSHIQTLPTLDFAEVSTLLVQANTKTEPSEVHGIICGLVCSGTHLDGKSWLEHVLGQTNLDEWSGSKAFLIRLYDQISQQFNGIEFKFNMLLPDSSHSLAERTLALTQWCKGFLSGLYVAGFDPDQIQNENNMDALYRFSELAQLDPGQIENTNEDVLTFEDLTEFVRKAVWSLYIERAYLLPAETGSRQDNKALH
jgi:uncharacterized protein